MYCFLPGYQAIRLCASVLLILWYESVMELRGNLSSNRCSFLVSCLPTHGGAVSEPDYNYFPSISTHTDAWQYTDNLFGWGVDGSVDFTGVFTMADKIISGGYFDVTVKSLP